MLYHCVQAGLDMAIVNPAQITPYAEIPAQERTLVEDLIFNRQPEALTALINHFEASGPIAKNKARSETSLVGLSAGTARA